MSSPAHGDAGLCRHDPARARRGLFLNVTPILRKKRLIIEVFGFDPSLGRKAIAKSLKRDVGLLGPRGLQKITVRHQLGCPVAAIARRTLASHPVQPVQAT